MDDQFEKRYQVFVSSTHTAMEEERAEVIQSLLEIDSMPAGMGMLPADNDDQWSLIKSVIDDCDYYMVIVGGPNRSAVADALSYAEREYDYAASVGKPMMGFVRVDAGNAAPEGAEPSGDPGRRKLDAFRTKVTQRMSRSYRTGAELRAAVTTSFVNLRKRHPAEGWVRGRFAAQPEMLAAFPKLHARVTELEEQLQLARHTAPLSAKGLASGADPVSFALYFTGKGGEQSGHTITTTWDAVFAVIAPEMFEPQIERTLAEFLATNAAEAHAIDAGNSDAMVRNPFVASKDFQRVKVQFFALGLIEKASSLRTESGQRLPRWQLTALGIERLTGLLAVRSAHAEGEDVGIRN